MDARNLMAALAATLATVWVAAAAADTRRSAESMQRIIDEELAAAWGRANVAPSDPASDAEFHRRVALDVAGRVPTRQEARAFLSATGGDRARLVDDLLASPDHADFFALRYFDLFFGRRMRIQKPLDAAMVELRSVFSNGQPFDDFAREMLAGEGSVRDNPALAYLASERLRKETREVTASTVSRVFLGVQIQCAQCHDHPTDDAIKREDFIGFTAMLGRARILPRQSRALEQKEVIDHRGELRPRQMERLRRKAARRGTVAYAIEQPRFLGREVSPRDGESRRELLARLITDSDLFAKVTVNRTWYWLMGRALVEPWDDLGLGPAADHPPLLERLAAEFRASGFDHRALVRAIVLSKAYGLSSRGPEDAERDALFARRRVRQLSPDQLLRSQMVATGIARLQLGAAAERSRRRVERQYIFAFGDDEGTTEDAYTGSIPQTLLLLNGKMTNVATTARPGLELRAIVDESADAADRIEELFLAAYARPPTDAELERWSDYVARRGQKESRGRVRALEDLFYALLISGEFASNH